ncbi:MAG: endonuclease V [Armatimonadota bacterium]
MELHLSHPWEVSLAEAERLQRGLREQLTLTPPPDFAPRLAAGADVSSNKHTTVVFAGFVVIDLSDMTTVAEASALTEATFPYVPGFLSFREIPALAEAWKKLDVRPDVLIVDGQGIAHPRRMGIASHAGLVFGVPTVGCAKSLLVGHYDVHALGEERGSVAPVLYHDEEVGVALRTRDHVAPVYVSPGNWMDLTTAVSLVMQLTPNGKYRLPETTRRAHRLVNDLRIAAGD